MGVLVVVVRLRHSRRLRFRHRRRRTLRRRHRHRHEAFLVCRAHSLPKAALAHALLFVVLLTMYLLTCHTDSMKAIRSYLSRPLRRKRPRGLSCDKLLTR